MNPFYFLLSKKKRPLCKTKQELSCVVDNHFYNQHHHTPIRMKSIYSSSLHELDNNNNVVFETHDDSCDDDDNKMQIQTDQQSTTTTTKELSSSSTSSISVDLDLVTVVKESRNEMISLIENDSLEWLGSERSHTFVVLDHYHEKNGEQSSQKQEQQELHLQQQQQQWDIEIQAICTIWVALTTKEQQIIQRIDRTIPVRHFRAQKVHTD